MNAPDDEREARCREEFDRRLASGELQLQACSSCGYIRHPPTWLCPECWSEQAEWRSLSGDGVVEAFVWYLVKLEPHPAGLPEVPYNVALVALAEGPRLLTNVVGAGYGELRAGMAVRAQPPFGDVLRFHVMEGAA